MLWKFPSLPNILKCKLDMKLNGHLIEKINKVNGETKVYRFIKESKTLDTHELCKELGRTITEKICRIPIMINGLIDEICWG